MRFGVKRDDRTHLRMGMHLPDLTVRLIELNALARPCQRYARRDGPDTVPDEWMDRGRRWRTDRSRPHRRWASG